ncbi:MAG: Transcriptional regulator, DeoR family [Flaviaesturariibacter sp.]|nr:Transcriptional regulator, DeoR family [Flaviaesturariibacter sp.]
MLKQERQAYILHQVNLHNKILAVDLCQHINVSNDTIRRDLQELADKGSIIKVHGGALSNSFHKGNLLPEAIYSHAKKQIIAQKAVSLIKDGMFVITGGGTTISELAKALPVELNATFISGSLTALMEYAKHPNIEVISIGDKVSKASKMSIGPDGIMKVRQFTSDLCFLGINAIDLHNGVSDNDWDVVQMKRAMIDSSKMTVCLTISEKINSLQPIQVCSLKAVDLLITELPADHPLLKPYADAGVRIL